MDKDVKALYDQAAAYAQKVFRKQAPGSLSKAVTVKYVKGKMVIGYGNKSYGIFVDYGNFGNRRDPLKIPENAKWSPKGFGPNKKGIEPRFFTVMGKKDLDKFYGFIEEAINLELEKQFETV